MSHEPPFTPPSHGGKRPGAGRPRGSGKFGEPTVAVRLPQSAVHLIQQALAAYRGTSALGTLSEQAQEETAPASRLWASLETLQDNWPLPTFPSKGDATLLGGVDNHPSAVAIPLYESRVAAGFPSPVTDYEEGRIDLNTLLIKHPAATFLVRVQGDSMIKAGIHPNDVLVVDRSVPAIPGKIVIAVLDGELTVKRLVRREGCIFLMPENDQYPPIEVKEGQHFAIWGVVTNVIHSV